MKRKLCIYLFRVHFKSDERECLLASMGAAVGAVGVAVSQPYWYSHVFRKVRSDWLAIHIYMILIGESITIELI